jgi:hypothetical protein
MKKQDIIDGNFSEGFNVVAQDYKTAFLKIEKCLKRLQYIE